MWQPGEELIMTRLAFATVLAASLLPLAAAAAPGCTISPVTGLFTPRGAIVTMDVVNNGRPCGELLWVQEGVIPFEALRATREPQHGTLTVSDPTRFSYTPVTNFSGTDTFEILGRGNTKGGAQVTGVLRVTATVRNPQ
jgi:hypothetical protein